MGHPAFVADRERQVSEKSRLGLRGQEAFVESFPGPSMGTGIPTIPIFCPLSLLARGKRVLVL